LTYHYRLIGKIAEPKKGDPAFIWENRNTTRAHKMQLLYALSNELLEQPSIEAALYSSISLSYVGSESLRADDWIAWFFRDTRELISASGKRPGDQVEKRDDLKKKRKIRNGRNVDIGSILGTFM